MKLKFLVSTIVSIMIWPASIMAQSELIPMIEIPAGNFYMGTLGEDENYDEAPMHKVHISKPFKTGSRTHWLQRVPKCRAGEY